MCRRIGRFRRDRAAAHLARCRRSRRDIDRRSPRSWRPAAVAAGWWSHSRCIRFPASTVLCSKVRETKMPDAAKLGAHGMNAWQRPNGAGEEIRRRGRQHSQIVRPMSRPTAQTAHSRKAAIQAGTCKPSLFPLASFAPSRCVRRCSRPRLTIAAVALGWPETLHPTEHKAAAARSSEP